jgi:hypothetical protein
MEGGKSLKNSGKPLAEIDGARFIVRDARG